MLRLPFVRRSRLREEFERASAFVERSEQAIERAERAVESADLRAFERYEEELSSISESLFHLNLSVEDVRLGVEDAESVSRLKGKDPGIWEPLESALEILKGLSLELTP